MDGRIDDDDAFWASMSAAPPYHTLDSHSDNSRVDPPTEEEEDEEAEEQELSTSINKFSFHEDQRGPTKPKLFDRFDYSSSDDDFYSAKSGAVDNGAVQSAGKRLDYMIQFLDRQLSSPNSNDQDDSEHQILPEYLGSGGGSGMFKVPVRAAVHPGRPPSLELRPHPLRETQIGCFPRTLACTDSQLWAGTECGLRFWNLSDVYAPGSTGASGDEDAAPSHESVQTSPTLCLLADAGNRLIWSGHRDGKIRSWKMDQYSDRTPFKESLSWQAHRGPVLSMVFTSFGNYQYSACHYATS